LLEEERMKTFAAQDKIRDEFVARHPPLKGASQVSVDAYLEGYYEPKDFYDDQDKSLNEKFKGLKAYRSEIVSNASEIRKKFNIR
jgi:hypothetical protein